jgi:GPH family glycoside/pentoside/hexuronide:cation symporter
MDNTAPRLGLAQKVGYGSWDFVGNLSYQVISIFLIYYFTDVFGIPPAAAGAIFLVSKLWDAVTDPAMGIVSDLTRSRWGKKRPYLLFGAVPLGLSIFLLFAGPDLLPQARIIWGYATFILFSTAITVVNIPYGALTAVLTRDSAERASLSGYRMTFALVGTLFAASATKVLAGLFGSELLGFRFVGALYGVIAIALSITTFLATRENVPEEKPERLTVRRYLNVIFGNAPFLILALSTLLFMIAVNMLAAVVNYYFKYYLRSEGLVTFAFIGLFVVAALFIPLFVFLSRRRGKKLVILLGMGVMAAVLLGLFFAGRSIPLTLALFVIGGFGMSTVFLSPWSMIPDTVEYSELKTGLRREGILYGGFFFCFKLGSAISGWLTGIGLAAFGYQPNVEQSARSLLGIRLFLTLVPLAFILLGIAVVSFYPITASYHRSMLAQIETSRSNGAKPSARP